MFFQIFNKCSSYNLQNNLFGTQFVRWRRKPRWVPIAKSRIFRIPEHPKQDEDEKIELKRLHNQYKTQMRSVRAYLRDEFNTNKVKTTSDHVYITPEQAEKEFQLRLQLNDEWNKAIALEREERIMIARKEREEYIKTRLELAEYREEDTKEKAKQIVLKQMELSKTFITKENLDQKIEEILANPVDHNFSIDLQRNIIKNV